jgi:dihydroorotate dehydrogenase electron transfer subunit
MSVSEVLPGAKGHPERIRILHKVVGRGTALLSTLSPGDRVQLLGPLGEPFEIPPAAHSGAPALMIAGGIGVAIFPFLVPALRRAGWTPILLFGARGEPDLVRLDWFREAQVELRTATEDGSHGTRGLVTSLLEDALTSPDGSEMLYACGPRPMLQAVANRANALGVPCQLSLESYMGCGFGVCLGCVVKVRRGDDFAYARVCVEGPTFLAKEVLWD